MTYDRSEVIECKSCGKRNRLKFPIKSGAAPVCGFCKQALFVDSFYYTKKENNYNEREAYGSDTKYTGERTSKTSTDQEPLTGILYLPGIILIFDCLTHLYLFSHYTDIIQGAETVGSTLNALSEGNLGYDQFYEVAQKEKQGLKFYSFYCLFMGLFAGFICFLYYNSKQATISYISVFCCIFIAMQSFVLTNAWGSPIANLEYILINGAVFSPGSKMLYVLAHVIILIYFLNSDRVKRVFLN